MRPKKRKEMRLQVTWIDVLLILLALSAAVLGAFYLFSRRRGEAEREFICTLRIPAVEKSLLEAHRGNLIPVGSTVRTENGTAALGRVREVREVPHGRAVLREGELVWENDEVLHDLELTVIMRGLLKGSEGIRIKDIRIAAGGQGSFRIGSYLARCAEILSVEEVWE